MRAIHRGSVLKGILLCSALALSSMSHLAAASSAAPATPAPAGNPHAATTYECAGLYWKTPDAGECRVRVRQKGASAWKQALSLVYDARDSEYRGSVVGLKPDTAYEAELTVGEKTTPVAFRTRADRFPVGKTTIIPAGETTETFVITESGTPEAYHLVTVAPGTRSTIDLRNRAPHGIEVKASYVILRGLEVRNAGVHGIVIRAEQHDIVVEECHTIFWGRIGGAMSFGNEGNVDSGIMAERGTRNLTLQRNLIEHPRGASNDWDTGHPAGPQGISIMHSLGGNVIRYNEIWSTEDHGFNDAIGGGSNFSDQGNLNRDSDVYGNILRNVWDDAIEAEGANMNVRIWGNYMHQFYVGIATAATYKGPLYVFRNVTGSSRRTHLNPAGGNMIKTGDRDFGGGRRLVFHNTALQPGGVVNIFSAPTPNCVSRNNIFEAPGKLAPTLEPGSVPDDHDYNLFNGAELGGARMQHGVVNIRLRSAYIASYRLEFYPASTVTGVKIGKIPVKFGHEEKVVTDPVLLLPNPAIDSGERLPGFNDDFAGKAPDLGAFEIGRPSLEYGRRAYLKHDQGWAAWERY
ncbi:MAG: right-handed parallel beta-helix repeat-containing protein [Verrucomicrobiota bacterium]